MIDMIDEVSMPRSLEWPCLATELCASKTDQISATDKKVAKCQNIFQKHSF